MFLHTALQDWWILVERCSPPLCILSHPLWKGRCAHSCSDGQKSGVLLIGVSVLGFATKIDAWNQDLVSGLWNKPDLHVKDSEGGRQRANHDGHIWMTQFLSQFCYLNPKYVLMFP